MIGYRTLQVSGFTIDSAAQRPIAILKDEPGETTFPLWLTAADVVAISAELISRDLGGTSGRKDLLAAILDGLELKAESVTLDGDLTDGYRAMLTLAADDGVVEIDVHPAIALAASLKYHLPVHVSEETLLGSALVDLREEHPLAESCTQQYRDLLENLNPAQMGKFPI